MAKLIDETGNQYGYLTVIRRGPNEGTRATWVCKCKCGNETVVSGKSLRNGTTKSCGCLQKEVLIQKNMERGGGDLTGQRFGKLVVIGFDSWNTNRSGHRDRMWKCQCDCGNICIVNHRYLKCGDTASCGCAHSKGNATITRLLNQSHIKYTSEYIVPNFITKAGSRAPFDFAIFSEDNQLLFLIEYQGNIHFYATNNGWNTEEELEKRKMRDQEKFEYCKNNNIQLYYITYLDNIEEKIKEILNNYGIEFNINN